MHTCVSMHNASALDMLSNSHKYCNLPAEGTRIALQTMAEAQGERMHDGSGPKLGGLTMKQPTFDWNMQDKYSELKTF